MTENGEAVALLLNEEQQLEHADTGLSAAFARRSQWLRAAVLGAVDGLVTVGALLFGIGAARLDHYQLVISAVAAAVSGSLSMAVGEFVAVDQQAEIERADALKAQDSLGHGGELHQDRVNAVKQEWMLKGLSESLAAEVAEALIGKGEDDSIASPVAASLSSGLSFITGSLIPGLTLFFPDLSHTTRLLVLFCVVNGGLLLLGGVAAFLGGTSVVKGSLRLLLGGLLAISISYGVGSLFGTGAG